MPMTSQKAPAIFIYPGAEIVAANPLTAKNHPKKMETTRPVVAKLIFLSVEFIIFPFQTLYLLIFSIIAKAESVMIAAGHMSGST